ncbi:MAG: hypothetical protein Q4P65_01510 [Eubacteriales bacterium]|nr:hypothetical protein [Eubacteriales bacterium]
MIYIVVGILGSLLMFLGDMCLYYSEAGFDPKNSEESIFENLRQAPTRRLCNGAFLGPIAAYLYSISYYHFVYYTLPEFSVWAWAAMLISMLGIIIGGAFHHYFAALGMVLKSGSEEALESLLKHFNFLKIWPFLLNGLGLLIWAGLILCGKTSFPSWLAFLTPAPLMLLLIFWYRLPKRARMIVAGGWTNLGPLTYYVLALVLAALS